MRKKLFVLLFTLLPFTITACGSTKDASVESSASLSYSNEEYGTATIGAYKNLSVEKIIYEVTEDAISESIDTMLYDCIEYNEVNRPSQSGDILLMTLKASNNGEIVMEYTEEDEFYLYLGDGELGSAVDQELTDVSAGDKLTFSVTYEEDHEITEFAGSKIDFQVNVLKIEEEVVPELTENFIKETLGYESQAALEESIRKELESENELTATHELRESLIQQVVENSEIESYSQALYDGYAAGVKENYQYYAEMFGCETVEEVYEMFNMTEEDVASEILSYVHRAIVVQGIVENEKLALTDEEYENGLKRYTEEFGYESTDELISDYGEESLYTWIEEEKVLDFLEEHAIITEVKASAVEEMETEEE